MTTIREAYLKAQGGITISLTNPEVIEALNQYTVDTENQVSGKALTKDEAVEEILYAFLVADLYK